MWLSTLLNQCRDKLERYPEHWRENGYWLLALLTLLPALRADLLLPHNWYSSLGGNYSLPPVENPFGFLALLLAAFAATLAHVSGERWRYLAAVPFLLILLADSLLGQILQGLSSVYVISAFAVFVYFLFASRVLSLPFGVFMLMLLLAQNFDGLLTWPQILIFAAIALTCSLVINAVRQNLPLARQLGTSNMLELTARTFSLWWPMLILIVIGLWFSNQITTGTERLLYERGYVVPYCNYSEKIASEITSDMTQGPFPCPNRENEEVMQRFIQLPFFDSADLTVKQQFSSSRTALIEHINTIDETALKSADRSDDEARRLFSVVPESTGMRTKTCYFPDIACAAANVVVNGLNSAYRKARHRAQEDFIKKVHTRATQGAKDVDQLTDDTEKDLLAYHDSFEQRTRQSIARVHTAANLLQQILLLWLVIVMIKSFLYVFARVIFDKSTNINVDLLEQDGIPAEGKVQHEQEVNIPGNYPYDIYYKTDYQPLGPAPRFSIPQWRSSVLSRMRYGAWNMNRVVMPFDDERGVTFNSIEAEHIIDWELIEGEEVIFSYKNFIAMNENIELRTIISLRVATLLLGRIVFHSARCKKGPGRLLLRTRGKPATAEQVCRSIPASRLVAWNRYARFSVDSHLTCADIFLNGFNLRRSSETDSNGPQGILIVESDARTGGVLVGTARFAKNFLLPI